MFREAEMKNSSPLMLDHQEHEQLSQTDRRHAKKVDRHDLLQVIVQEGFPGLRGRPVNGP